MGFFSALGPLISPIAGAVGLNAAKKGGGGILKSLGGLSGVGSLLGGIGGLVGATTKQGSGRVSVAQIANEARAAGINPLAALGSPIAGQFGTSGSSNVGAGIEALGRGIEGVGRSKAVDLERQKIATEIETLKSQRDLNQAYAQTSRERIALEARELDAQLKSFEGRMNAKQDGGMQDAIFGTGGVPIGIPDSRGKRPEHFHQLQALPQTEWFENEYGELASWAYGVARLAADLAYNAGLGAKDIWADNIKVRDAVFKKFGKGGLMVLEAVSEKQWLKYKGRFQHSPKKTGFGGEFTGG